MHNRFAPKRVTGSQRGFTLLELLLALAVVAFLSFVVFRAYQNSRNAAEVRAAVSDIGTIQATLSNVYPNGYAGLGTGTANLAHVFPTDMNANTFTAGQAITNQWNGTVTLAVGVAPNEYTLTYGAVPSAACVQLASQAGQNAIDETVNAVDVFSSNQVNPALVAKNCNTVPTPTIVITGN